MHRHVSALGFLYALFGLCAAGAGALLFALGTGSIGAILREVLEIIGYGHLVRWLGAGVGLSLVGAGGLCFVTAYGLFARRPWGRFLALLGSLSQVVTLSWPALLGLYGFWVLLSADGARAFRRAR
jgi:hypothetical protein